MGLKHMVDLYNIYYVYQPTRISRGTHLTAINFFYLGFVLMILQLFAAAYARGMSENIKLFLLSTLTISIAVFIAHNLTDQIMDWLSPYRLRLFSVRVKRHPATPYPMTTSIDLYHFLILIRVKLPNNRRETIAPVPISHPSSMKV